jgi:tetratricopeptide (TPR) repeat protein
MVIHDAYVLAAGGDALAGEHRYDQASQLYRDAAALAPESTELRFWAGLGAAQLGDLDVGIAEVREVIAQSPGWGELLARLSDDVIPSISAVKAALGIASA